MKEHSVTIDEWDWCIDDESRLDPWFHIFREVEEKFTVKADRDTCLFAACDGKQRNYLVKHYSPTGIKDHLIAFFSARAQAVYDSSQLLHRCGIPCAEYPGWGKNGTESMILSVAIPDAVTGLEYWFRTAAHQPVLRKSMIANLAKLIASCAAAAVTVPDLALEHILIKKDGSSLTVINPRDAEKMEGGLSAAARRELLKPFLEIRGEVSPEILAVALLDAGFAGHSGVVAEILHQQIDEFEQQIEDGEWPEFAGHVRDDESGPLCRVLRNGDDILRLRNTVWHAEMPIPDDANSTAEEIGEDEAKRLWLDSFLAQLLRRPCPRLPLSWEQKADGRNIIRCAVRGEDIAACGFAE